MKINSIILTCTCFLLACLTIQRSHAQERTNNDNYIYYYIFDSLEHYLCKQIKYEDSANKNPVVGILINATCHSCPGIFKYAGQSESEDIFEIYILFRSWALKYKMPKISNKYDSMIAKSNRRMWICGSTYPVYFLGIDNIFSTSSSWKNHVYRQDNIQPPAYLYGMPVLYIDMTKKKILRGL